MHGSEAGVMCVCVRLQEQRLKPGGIELASLSWCCCRSGAICIACLEGGAKFALTSRYLYMISYIHISMHACLDS